MDIDRDLIIKIAGLARLEIEPDQADKFAHQSREIIEYMDCLNQVDTTGVEPFYSPSDKVSVMREDVCLATHERKDILDNAPGHDGKYFIVPRII